MTKSNAHSASVNITGLVLGLVVLGCGFYYLIVLAINSPEALMMPKVAHNATIGLATVAIGLGLSGSVHFGFPKDTPKELVHLGLGVTILGIAMLVGTGLIRLGILPLAY